jgi:hypothetical protein
MKKTTATAQKDKAKARSAKSTTKHNLRHWEQSPVPAAVVLVVVVFACYANSLGNGFVFDDDFLVPAYGRAHGFFQLVHTLINSYRPVRSATYAIDFMIWGDRPFGFHLTNVLIHAANTVLAFLLIRRFAASTRTAFLAALMFAVHPIQTDAVSYVSGRRDILFALFYLAAFTRLSYRASRSVRFLVLFLGFWALSCLSRRWRSVYRW